MTAIVCNSAVVCAQDALTVHHTIAAIEKDRFHGWPANNGVWQWGDEILVAFTQGDFVLKAGHNIAGRQDTKLSRSIDGGRTWTMFDPREFLDDEHLLFRGEHKTPLTRAIDFSHSDLALRVFADGYHGNQDPEGGFFHSQNRGATWQGPYTFNGFADHPEIEGKLLSPRTDYLVQNKDRCLIFFSAHVPTEKRKRIGCMQTRNGGQSFEFLSWVTPQSTSASAIMSQTVQFSDNEFVLTYRKIHSGSEEPDTIEAWQSTDGCQTWNLLSTVKVMQTHSNPPALVKLSDGRLCCAYGDRRSATICAKYSDDRGASWGPEFVIRDDFQPMKDDPDSKPDGFADMGYVRMVERTDGNLVAMYYWATAEHPQHHIAVSTWKP